MITEVISEDELRRIMALWFLEHDKGACIPPGHTKEEYIEDFRIPDVPLTHTQSMPDLDGNISTLLKGEIRLSDWETKQGKKEERFIFYKVLTTLTDNPDLEPILKGYIAVT